MALQIQHRAILKPFISPFIPKEWFEEQSVTGMECTINGLDPTTEYEIRVAAFSGKGMGDFASQRHFTLPADENGREI